MLTCPSAEIEVENIRVKILEGAIYSVEDVSDLLGIPRPTLYRYLREYSIPHLRQGGRIRIPEDSFDRIREARDLHKEGLGTESVRRQLREGGPDPGDLDRRLNRLHDTLEDLKGDIKSRPGTGEVALSPALQTILARQSLMLSAMFNLTGMVEDLLLSNGRSRRRSVPRLEGATPITIPAEEQDELPGTVVADHEPIRRSDDPTVPPTAPAESHTRFGSLSRRRRNTLALLSAAAMALLLALFLPTLVGEDTVPTDRPASRDAGGQQTPAENRAGAGAEDEQDSPANGGEDNGTNDTTEGVAAATSGGASQTTQASEGARDSPAASGTDEGVPDVSGQPVEEAARNISEAGYTVAAIRSRTGPEDPGTVVGIEPSAGTEAPSDAPVVLTMSTGPAGASSADASPASISSASATASASASPAGAAPANSSTTASAPSASASASASPSP
jgi:excisionase family DNA binding protein